LVSASSSSYHLTSSGGMKIRLSFDYYGQWGTLIPFQFIRVFTDGSASLPHALLSNQQRQLQLQPSSSWGICYGDENFGQMWSLLPNENLLGKHHLNGFVLIGDSIPISTSTGIYMAELQAIARALLSLPITWSVEIVTDSKSSIEAIHTYQNAVSDRRRLRMSGRPILSMISMLIRDRIVAGGKVDFIHVKSHTTDDNKSINQQYRNNSSAIVNPKAQRIHIAGNMCADFIADQSRVKSVSQSQFQPLRIELGEPFVYLQHLDSKEELNANQIVFDDIRVVCHQSIKQNSMNQWLKSESQKYFACWDILPLCREVMRAPNRDDEAKIKSNFLLPLVTNTLQYQFIDDAAVGEKVRERLCKNCDQNSNSILTSEHLVICPSVVSEQNRNVVLNEIKLSIQTTVGAARCVNNRLWNRLNQQSNMRLIKFMSLLLRNEIKNELCRILWGGFSNSEFELSLDELGVSKGDDRKELCMNIRSLLFNSAMEFFNDNG